MAFVAMVGVALGATAGTMTAAVIGGAVIGAVVGGVTAAVKGESILKGVLIGGVLGAVGGAIGGATGIGGATDAMAISEAASSVGMTGTAAAAQDAAYAGTVAELTGSTAAASAAPSVTSPGLLSGMSAGEKMMVGSTLAQTVGAGLDDSAEKQLESQRESEERALAAQRVTPIDLDPLAVKAQRSRTAQEKIDITQRAYRNIGETQVTPVQAQFQEVGVQPTNGLLGGQAYA